MSAEFAASRVVTARKAHVCQECRRTIQPGQSYQREAGCWEGDFWHLRACLHCAAMRLLVVEIDPGYREVYYGGLPEWTRELATEFRLSLPLLRAVVNFRRKWTRLDGSLVDVPGGAS